MTQKVSILPDSAWVRHDNYCSFPQNKRKRSHYFPRALLLLSQINLYYSASFAIKCNFCTLCHYLLWRINSTVIKTRNYFTLTLKMRSDLHERNYLTVLTCLHGVLIVTPATQSSSGRRRHQLGKLQAEYYSNWNVCVVITAMTTPRGVGRVARPV